MQGLPDYNALRIGPNLFPAEVIEDRGLTTDGGGIYRIRTDFGGDEPREFEVCECHLLKLPEPNS